MYGCYYREVQGVGSECAQTSVWYQLKPLCSVLYFTEPGCSPPTHPALLLCHLDPSREDQREIKGRQREEPEPGPFLICLLSLSARIGSLQHGPFTLAVVSAPISSFFLGTSKSLIVAPERRKHRPDSTFSSEG